MGISELMTQFEQFKTNQYVQGGKEFLQSNSIIAKFAFLILILLVFMMLLSLGSFIMALLFSNKHNPILLDGLINSTQMMIIPQDPSKKGAVPIYRSNNEREGMEFTWSVWIFVNDFGNTDTTSIKHVFHKGSNTMNVTGSGAGGQQGENFPINGPGLYIIPRIKNSSAGDVAGLKVIMNSFENIDEEVTVSNLPLNKWVNVILRVTKQNQLDVYINGTLSKRHMLTGVPRQNYGDVYLSMNGGFSGNTSSLRYFEKALGTNAIQNIVNKGPNKIAVAGTMDIKHDTTKYLSTRWFLNSAIDTTA